ncbi:MAG TPA: hypothetical protein VJ963_13280 [Bacteroidales bacterium]|nr:hypothetical protein [Bacteroidales bacterium]
MVLKVPLSATTFTEATVVRESHNGQRLKSHLKGKARWLALTLSVGKQVD